MSHEHDYEVVPECRSVAVVLRCRMVEHELTSRCRTLNADPVGKGHEQRVSYSFDDQKDITFMQPRGCTCQTLLSDELPCNRFRYPAESCLEALSFPLQQLLESVGHS
jgi:hypothetical protein